MDKRTPPPILKDSEQMRIALETFFRKYGTKYDRILPDGSIEIDYCIEFSCDVLSDEDNANEK